MAILFQFITAKEFAGITPQHPFFDCAYPISTDGGRKYRPDRIARGSLINCGHVINKTPWLSSLTKDGSTKSKRFIPMQQQEKNQWVIEVMPGFVHECLADQINVPRGVKGIYCYIANDGEVLYIGQGDIATRVAQHRNTKDMKSAFFRYTEIADARIRKLAEKHHLENFFREHGKLPRFNLIRA